MTVRLRNMNAEEYSRFKEYSIADSARDLVRSENIPEARAMQQAGEMFESILPQGAETADQYLMILEDPRRETSVGWIWYLYETHKGIRQVFLADLLVEEAERRKGAASAALAEMEKAAARDGCRESVLYIWKHNGPAFRLYQKCGYLPFRPDEHGMYMKKELALDMRREAGEETEA